MKNVLLLAAIAIAALAYTGCNKPKDPNANKVLGVFEKGRGYQIVLEETYPGTDSTKTFNWQYGWMKVIFYDDSIDLANSNPQSLQTHLPVRFKYSQEEMKLLITAYRSSYYNRSVAQFNVSQFDSIRYILLSDDNIHKIIIQTQ